MKHETRLNFRPALFCAIGLAFGIFLYAKCRFGGLSPSDFLFIALFLGAGLIPFSPKRILAVLLCTVIAAGIGALRLHIYTERFNASAEEGAYRLTGTVQSVAVKRGYCVAVLRDLTLNGEETGGRCRLILSSAELSPADVIAVDASVKPVRTDDFSDPYVRAWFAADVRYRASAGGFERFGISKDPFLWVNRALFTALYGHMEEDEADLAYGLLTGSTASLDADLGDAVRRGGIAHIFAVSGLHIGILYAAAQLLFRFLKKYRFLPALTIAFLYCGVCGFTVSAVRAFIMYSVLGAFRAVGRKHDFLGSIAFAAIAVLLFLPAQWFAAGMKLSFGACIGLALFAGPLSRVFSRVHMPAPLGRYLSSALSVQIFTFPVLMDAFGYFSVWGFVLNFFLLPVLPFVFPGVLLCTLFAVIIPPAAGFFLLFPQGIFSLLLYILSVVDVSFVICGFSLGAGGVIWLTGCAALSPRVRLRPSVRAVCAAAFSVLFALTVTLENVVFTGVRLDVWRSEDGYALLARTPHESVLVIDGVIGVRDCEDFLRRTYGGRADLVVVLSDDELDGINTAAFLPAEAVRARDEIETGLTETNLLFGESFSCGGMTFRYETREKLLLYAEGLAVEVDFHGNAALGADFFLGEGCGGLKYLLDGGIIKQL